MFTSRVRPDWSDAVPNSLQARAQDEQNICQVIRQMLGGGCIKGLGLTFSMNRSVGAKRPLVALAAVKPRVMCGEKMWLASKCEPSPPDLMNRSCGTHTPH